MTMTSALLVLGLALAATLASPLEESRHQRELREHYNHLSYIADYSCHHPQPRSVPVQELLSPYQTRGKAYFPEYTVLHRCDVFAGCCEGPKKCGPLHADSVHLPFKVTYLEDMGEHHKGEWEMEYVSFDNHTVCGCLDLKGLYTPEVGYKDHRKPGHHGLDHHHGEDHHGLDHHGEDHHGEDHHGEDHEHKFLEEKDHKEVKYGGKPEKRPENKKIDSLYITL